MKNLKAILLTTIIILLIAHFSAHAQTRTNVRGKAMTNNSGQQIPLVSARIDLCYNSAASPKLQVFATTYTDGYGFYYFRNVPVGYYTVQINQNRNLNIQVIAIDNTKFIYQDLPLFVL